MVADAAPADARPLTQKYRPVELDDVWGQDDVINSIKDLFKRAAGIPPVFLFLGPSGCGKTTLARIVQAGVVPMDTAAVASELQRTWNRDDAAEWAEIYTKIFPEYQLLIESYGKAQEVVQKNEVLDSART